MRMRSLRTKTKVSSPVMFQFSLVKVISDKMCGKCDTSRIIRHMKIPTASNESRGVSGYKLNINYKL